MLWGEGREQQKLMKDYEQIKQQVNLTELAAHFGYEMIRKESSRNCVMMRYQHHKIAITRDSDGHYIYYTIGDSLKTDCGSVIDFVMNRKQSTFQEAVTYLKQYEHIPDTHRPANNLYVSKIEPSSKDTQAVIKNLIKMPLMSESAYLASRGITKDTLTSPRFHGRIYKDARNNVIFPITTTALWAMSLKTMGLPALAPTVRKLYGSAIWRKPIKR